MSSPIADLTYRGYDGPLDTPTMRWWVIARVSMQQAIARRGFWIWASLSAYWYVILGAVFYFMGTLGGGQNAGMFMGQIKWTDQFLNAYSISQLLLFILALLIGIGSIANDNRANALLVYLSKPCTKGDYLLGKWMGIFLPLWAVSAVPMLGFYGYCYMSFSTYGFQENVSLLRLIMVTPIAAAFHASVCVGLSSMFNQSRLAGATYAGLYFLSLTFTKVMQVLHAINGRREQMPHAVVQLADTLYYASIDGIQIGLAKVVLGTDGSGLFPNIGGRGPGPIPAPNGPAFWAIYLGICGLSLLVAASRVRAVEVIRG